MVKLDYKTNNPRWGIKGVRFGSWESYSFILGYLSNPAHYLNLHPDSPSAHISLHLEKNNEQGAWEKEGRIHYYGKRSCLERNLKDLDDCSSAGVGKITRRINSNGYLLSLIHDYEFEIRTYTGYTTADVFPKDKEKIESRLKGYLAKEQLPNTRINGCLALFERGYNLRF